MGERQLLVSLFGRITRRKAIRVSIVYAVVASCVALGVYLAPFVVEVPQWAARIPLYFAAGFPVLVLFAWIFDRPRIVATGAGASAEELKRLRRARRIDYAIIGVLIIGIAAIALQKGAMTEAGLPFGDTSYGSIAVLAFTSPDPVVEYLGDGIAEELKHLLERVAGLEVASGSYSFQYKAAQRSAAEIGAELGVDAVLWGSVEITGETLRVKSHLTASSAGTVPLWTLTQEHRLDELQLVHAEIAGGVIATLAGGLLWSAPALPDAETIDAEAYRDYLKARHVQRLEARRSGKFIRELYESAIERAPKFSRAYTDYAAFVFWSGLPIGLNERESYALATDLLELANLRDPERQRSTRWLDSALLAHIEGDWEQEEFALRQHMLTPAAYRAPEHSVFERYGALLMRAGLFFEALRYYELAEAADPGNTTLIRYKGVAYLTLGKFDKALEEFDQGLRLAPSMFELHQLRAVALLGLGEVDEASEEWDYFYSSHRVRLHYARGERDLALEDLQQAVDGLDAESNLAGIRLEEIGYGYALLGEVDQAFEWWERALEFGPPRMQGIRFSRVPYRLADEPRYVELLDRLGLTDAWRVELCRRVALLESVTGIEASCLDVLSAE